MARTTFGEELKRRREKKKWSREYLASLYYGIPSSATTIARWERRENLPEAENIERLVEVFDLSYPDAMFWFGLAGKLPRLRMPSKRQTLQSLETMTPALQEHLYPAYVLDSRYFRFCLINSATVRLIGGIERVQELAKCTVFQLLFSRQLGIANLLGEDLPTVQREQIRRFKALNIYRRHEEFYMEYPERLRVEDGLQVPEYAAFEKLWNEVEPDDVPSTSYATLGDLTFQLDKPIKFRLMAETILHLGNFFTVSWYNVVDKEYETAALNVFGDSLKGECIKLWEIPELDTNALFS